MGACARPSTMYRLPGGKWGFNAREGANVERMQVNCGQCLLCRDARAIDLSTRMQHEAFMHERTCVPTLTYAPEHVTVLGRPQWRADVDTWLQDVRNVARRKWNQRVRYDVITEYSPVRKRPHVHAILFGVWPRDAVFWKRSKKGNGVLWRSAEFDATWPWGQVLFEEFTPGAAAYVANHQAFKFNGSALQEFLTVRSPMGDVLGYLEPELHLVSKRPGLGAGFFEKHGAQMMQLGHTVAGHAKVGLPRYYKRLADRVPEYADALAKLKEQGKQAILADAANRTPERLVVREEVAAASHRAKRNRSGVDGV